VHQRHRVQQFHGGGRTQDRLPIGTTSSPEPPVAEGGSQPFPAGPEQPRDLIGHNSATFGRRIHVQRAVLEEGRQHTIDPFGEHLHLDACVQGGLGRHGTQYLAPR
jgi:hypothetical protein